MARKRGRGMAACWYGIARTAVVDRAAAWAEIDDGGSRQDRHRRHRNRRGHSHRAGADRGARDGREAGARRHRRQRHRARAGSLARRRQPPDLHDRQRGGARLARGAQAVGRGHGRGLGRRCRRDRTGNGEIWAENTNHRITMGEAVQCAKSRGVVPVGSASFGTDTTGLDPVDGSGRPWQAYVFGCAGGRGRGRYRHRRGAGARHLGRARCRPRGQPAGRRRPDRRRHRAGARPRPDGGLQAR